MSGTSPVVISMGDPAGIGPEIILKAWAQRRQSGPLFACIGDIGTMGEYARHLGLPAPVGIETLAAAGATFPRALPVLASPVAISAPLIAGKPDPRHAATVKACIEAGVEHCLTGAALALVTAPIAKSVMYEAGFSFPGHTEFLAELTQNRPIPGTRGPAMMLAGGGLRVVLTSIHEPLAKAVANLSAARIEQIARLTHEALKRDFGLDRPRLALAGLNPHAGENGSLGREEIDIINPVAARLRADGIAITDALPPDTMFHAEARAGYDAAICLYHDQGLIPVKTLDFHGGVNITLGLPIVRTSPDHGTAFDIAGKGVARADSLLAALDAAAEIAGHRA
ncbi:4-hydroxythreonine-4-phosphate dehydrogenase PdxA [uncultured Maricaulis sp.]|uniref:4-hydroxythreonine-4-phosphate dehydrogenase PdxA n=1 Tax=uncultured Maricaulis sp. TaxID=174710 RepID=UPI0030DAF363|tara:strand:- start:8340 stop:9356 length:1017 start_codon:yes stop_codon:yes gene_type:complete